MSNKTGGPAFPHEYGDAAPGMTLRDYFAAKALNGMLSNGFMPEMALPAAGGLGAKWNYVGAAYFLADAMLKERAK